MLNDANKLELDKVKLLQLETHLEIKSARFRKITSGDWSSSWNSINISNKLESFIKPAKILMILYQIKTRI